MFASVIASPNESLRRRSSKVDPAVWSRWRHICLLLIDETPHAPSHINGRMPEDTQAGSIQWNKRHLELADPPQHKVPSDPVTRSQGASLLHIAIKNGSKGIAHTLVVGGGADVDARDVTNGDRPLHCAVRGLTPLELAVRLQEEEIVELLVEGGAQVL
ncbi:hypothetical protein HYQ44_016877 [Verticillium longisporum]|nr:hypothetical protein HYQ44_016877 [Verticillium longisporum]